jgi:hypothetical protein
MRRIKQTKPSPALLVAVVALVAALAGTAVGGMAVTSLSKKETKQVRKIANKKAKSQDKKQDERNFPVDSSQVGDAAVTSPKIADGAATSPKIADGAVTSPRIADAAVTPAKIADAAKGVPGYALVAGNGFVNNDEQRGVVGTNRPSVGLYCFDLSFEAQVVVASVETGPTAIAKVFAPGGSGGCPVGFKDAAVEIVDLSDMPMDKGFYVLFN